jgi:predicted metal-binding membrane protein
VTPEHERDRRVLKVVLVALAPLAWAALGASFVYSVEAMASGAPWRALGIEPYACPGCALCGMSRAFTSASHGEFSRALGFNPLVALLYPGFWALALSGPLAAVALLRSAARRGLRPVPSADPA